MMAILTGPTRDLTPALYFCFQRAALYTREESWWMSMCVCLGLWGALLSPGFHGQQGHSIFLP